MSRLVAVLLACGVAAAQVPDTDRAAEQRTTGSGALRPWTGAGFEAARVRDVSPSEFGGRPTELTAPLTLVLFDETNWTEARALRHIRKTAAIFAPCGVGLGPVRLARARPPGGDHDLDMHALYPGSNVPEQVVDLSIRIPSAEPWPRVFFVGRLLGDSALARSYRSAVDPSDDARYPYFNTAWVAYQAHWKERAEDGYSSLAHELAHILCRCGHTGGDTRHLLHEKRNFLGVRILDKDCERVRSSPLITRSGGAAE